MIGAAPEQPRGDRERGQLRDQQDAERGEVADGEVEAPAREHGQRADAARELHPDQQRDVPLQPATRA